MKISHLLGLLLLFTLIACGKEECSCPNNKICVDEKCVCPDGYFPTGSGASCIELSQGLLYGIHDCDCMPDTVIFNYFLETTDRIDTIVKITMYYNSGEFNQQAQFAQQLDQDGKIVIDHIYQSFWECEINGKMCIPKLSGTINQKENSADCKLEWFVRGQAVNQAECELHFTDKI